jgi:hypothetical protein
LYSLPLLAFVVEAAYGVACWRIFDGNWRLLAGIDVNNLINLPLFFAAGSAPDPNGPSAPTHLLAVSVIALEIAITWLVVWYFARSDRPAFNPVTGPSSNVCALPRCALQLKAPPMRSIRSRIDFNPRLPGNEPAVLKPVPSSHTYSNATTSIIQCCSGTVLRRIMRPIHARRAVHWLPAAHTETRVRAPGGLVDSGLSPDG